MFGARNREENIVLPERCGFRIDKFAGIQSYASNALVLFGLPKNAESPLVYAHAKRALSASHQFAQPVLPRQLHLVGVGYLDPKYGGKRRFLHDFLV